MRNLTATLCLTVAVLLVITGCGNTLRKLEPLAKQGDVNAQYNLGTIYQYGQGVTRNHQTAVKWYTLAAEQGDTYAQSNLGSMYQFGQGVTQNDKTAVKWYTLAAEQGNVIAQGKLGVMYALGDGVIRDNVYAHMWGNLSASNGNKNGAKLRDFVAKRMTPSQIKTAQRLARECVRKYYKGC